MLTTYHLMNSTAEGSAADAVVATEWEGVDLIPADEELGKIESDGSNDLVFRLDIAFEGLDLSPPYDIVLFDCAPSLGKVLFAVLIAADGGVVAVTERQSTACKALRNSTKPSALSANAPTRSWLSTR